MSYKVEIIEDSGSSSIEIQTSINDQEKSLDILENNTINLSVSHDIALLPSDLNDLITNGVEVFLVSDPLLSTLVSGLVPVRNINGSGYVNITSNSGNFIISVTGLQPSGNYALLSGASFTGPILSPTGIFASLKSNNINSISNSGNINMLSEGSGNVNIGPGTDLIMFGQRGKLLVNSVDFPQAIKAFASNNTSGMLTIGVNGTSVASGLDSTNIALYGYASQGQKNNYGLYIHKGHAIFNNKISIRDKSDENFDLDYIPQASVDISGSLIANSGNFYDTLKVNNIPVSISGHTHSVNDIINFSSGVSAIAPVKNITGIGYVDVSSVSGLYTINISGLQPSGSYANSIHTHNISEISGLQTILDNKQPSGNYSNVGHSHTTSSITDFNSSVSGLVSGIYAPLSGNLSQFSSTTSSQLRTLISDESGSGLLVFNDSPSFTGIVLVPTAPSGTNNNQIANTSFVRTEISNLVSSAPTTLDTLNELASALGNDSNFSTTVTNNLAGKANLNGATFTGSISGPSGDFTTLRQNGVIVSVSGHTHTINDVSGLQIALDNKQPSGSYAPLNHSHTASNITDFNSSVSGLLSVKNITSGSGINVSNISGIYTIAVTGNFGLTSEEVDDRVSNLLNAGTGILLSYNDNSNSLIISTSGLQPSGNYSIVGHSHVYTDISNFASGVQDNLTTTLLPGNYIDIIYNSTLDTLTIGASGLQPSGNYSIVGHSHIISDVSGLQTSLDSKQPSGNYAPLSHSHIASNITDFNSSVSGLLPVKNISGIGYVSVSSSSGNYTINVSGLQPSGNYTLVGHSHSISDVSGLQLALDSKQPSGSYAPLNHNHIASNITDFNSAVSGLLSVAVSGLQPSGNYSLVGHSHVSSDITNFDTSVSGLLPVKNILAGYDINITNDSGVYTVASTNLVHVDSQQPQGFINRTDSRISVSGNIFKIEPTGLSYSIYNKGIKVTKTSPETITIPSGLTQINYIHFNTNTNLLDSKTTPFDFNTDIPIAYIAWNGGINPSGQMTFFAEERHGIVMDTSTHKWIHNTFGMQYVDGLSISNYILGGNGSSNSHATISIGGGTLYQEDIEINITDSSSTDPFCQELSPIAQIPVYYHQGTTGQWVKNTATDYPVKYGANGPQYNLLTGSNWTTPDVSPGGQTRYFAAWILATNQIDDPIISIMGQRVDGNQGPAESNNSWADVNLTNLPLSEVKPLYRLIFAADSNSYTNVPKCRLMSILDIRVAVISTIAGVTQNDHGSLFGLGDDDHSQYLHVDNNRTVNAIHNFVNGLTVNGTSVSVSGHSHTSSDIVNFNASVSGLVSGVYAPLNSPALTGVPTVPTANSGTNNNQAASTAFVRTEISNLVSSAPSTLDTLNELATALGNDANFSTTVTNTLAGKANLNGATFTGAISSPSGNFTQSLLVNGTAVSVSGHTHVSSNITDFNSSVSGILPVKNIVAGSNITVSSSSGIYTINSTATGSSSTSVIEYNNVSNFPSSGVGSTIYISTDTGRIYRWASSVYQELGPVSYAPIGSDSRWDLFLPPAPTGLAVTARNTQVLLSWSAPTVSIQTPITDYTVQYSSNSGSSWTTFTRSASTSTTATVTGLTNEQAYVLRVAAVNGIGTGAYSTASSVVTPVAFSPSFISGLQAWYDASDASTLYDATSGGSLVAADGGVARWEDKSGNSRHATQATSASRPLRKASVQGGKDVLRFDGSNDFLTSSDFLDLSLSGDAITAFAVVKRQTTGAYHAILSKFDSTGSASTEDGWTFRFTDTNKIGATFVKDASLTTKVSDSTVSASSFTLFGFKAVAGSLTTSIVLYRQGAILASSVTSSSVQTMDNTTYPVQIGIELFRGSLYYAYSGDIAEIIIYNSALSDADRSSVESYLTTKWGIA